LRIHTRSQGGDPYVRQLELLRSAFSSSFTRDVWSCTRISTMPCAWAAVSIRETFERLVPSARATSSCDRPSRKYIRAALISAARSRRQASSDRSLSVTE
jgi:hypothetical protein